MRHFAIIQAGLIGILSATTVLSDESADWQALDGAAIAEALTDQVLDYGDGVWQDFRASGRTLYFAGHESWGYWAVRGDQYCSQWPPGALWDCYDVSRKQENGQIDILFTSDRGDRSIGRIR